MIRVLLVDDHAVVRTGFRLLLQARSDITVIGEAESGESACQRYIELSPDVVVMDIAMPGMGGIEALRLKHRRLIDLFTQSGVFLL